MSDDEAAAKIQAMFKGKKVRKVYGKDNLVRKASTQSRRRASPKRTISNCSSRENSVSLGVPSAVINVVKDPITNDISPEDFLAIRKQKRSLSQ